MLAQKVLKPVRPKVSFHLKLPTWMDLSQKACAMIMESALASDTLL